MVRNSSEEGGSAFRHTFKKITLNFSCEGHVIPEHVAYSETLQSIFESANIQDHKHVCSYSGSLALSY